MKEDRLNFDVRFMPQALLLMFFVSGACGLIHEVIWIRLFSRVMGSSTYATSMVISVFLTGLALGGYAGGKVVDRMRFSPLKVLFLLEGGIGLFALAMPLLIDMLGPVYVWMYQVTGSSFAVLTLVRFGFSALMLVVPTTLMGATLPLMTRLFAASRDQTAKVGGRLYGINTFGGVVGCFSAGFFLLPGLGISRTILVAAGGNLLVCAAAFMLLTSQARRDARSLAPQSAQERAKFRTGSESVSHAGAWTLTILLLGYGLSGFAALAYEVAWTRVLSMMVGSSTYAFTMILTAFVAGVALGSAACSRFVGGIKHPMAALGALQIAMGVTAFIVVPLMGVMPYRLTGIIARYSDSFWGLQLIEFAMILGITGIPTMIMGACFPLATRVFSLNRDGIGQSVGTVYGANTLGNILGAFAMGFILIPMIGIQKAIYAATALNMVAAALFLYRSTAVKTPLVKVAVTGSGFAVLGLGLLLVPQWNIGAMTFGPFYEAVRLPSRYVSSSKEIMGIAAQRHVLFHKDGHDVTVTVKEFPDQSRCLYINGKPDASSHGDLPSQILVAHLPLMMHPAPSDIMVIGLASGISLGSAALHPVDGIDCLEISPTIVEASQYFNAYNYNPLRNPKVNLIVGDGRNHLSLTRKTYDVIISEPSNPYFAGMSDLFTREFFSLMRERLNPGGLACAWVQSYLIDKETFRSIVAAFHTVFPRMTIWTTLKGDCMMVGARDDLSVPFADLAVRIEEPSIRADLQRIDIHSASDFLGNLLTGSDGAAVLVDGAAIHTDDNLIAEFAAPKALMGGGIQQASLTKALEAVRQADFSFILPGEDRAAHTVLAVAVDHVQARGKVHAYQEMKRTQNVHDLSFLQAAHALNPRDMLLQEVLDRMRAEAYDAFRRKNTAAAVQICKEILSVAPDDPKAHYNLATLYRHGGDLEQAFHHYAEAVNADPDYYQAHFNLAAMYARKGLPLSAQRHYEAVIRLNPEFYPAMIDLADLFLDPLQLGTDAVKKALSLSETASRLTRQQDPRVLWTLIAAQEKAGQTTSALETAIKALSLVQKDNPELVKALSGKIRHLQSLGAGVYPNG